MSNFTQTLDRLTTLAVTKIQSASPRWNADEAQELDHHLRTVFDSLTEQQYIYDIDGLKDRLQCLSALNLSGLELSLESRFVCRKLLAHQAYSEAPLYDLATRILLHLDEELERAVIEEKKKTWYRLFSIDHAVSRLYSEGGREIIRNTLIDRFLNLLSQAPSESYVLREAHFHGHLGNDCLRALQGLAGVGNNAVATALVHQANQHYKSAVLLRLEMLESQFRGQLGNRAGLNDIRAYLGTSGSTRSVRHQLELFQNVAQAISDTAQQITAMLSVACYHLIVGLRDRHDSQLEAVERLSSLSRQFWDLLRHQLVTQPGVGHYRVIQRRRISEHMLAILSRRDLIPSTIPIVSTDRYTTKLKDWELKILNNFDSLIP